MSLFEQKESIIQEIIDTERNYVDGLKNIIDVYQTPIEQANILPEKYIKSIFNNLMIIYNINKTILSFILDYHGMRHFTFTSIVEFLKLSGCFSGGKSIGKIFLKFAPYFKVYTDYCINYDKNSKLLKTLRETNPQFLELITKLETCHLQNGGHSLSHYLIIPVQRLPRYEMLLKELLKNSEPHVDDYENIMKATLKMKETTSYMNERIKYFANKNAVLVVQRRLNLNLMKHLQPESVGNRKSQDRLSFKRFQHERVKSLERSWSEYTPTGPTISIIEPHRTLIHSGKLFVFEDGELEFEPTENQKKLCEKEIFLFTDLILVCTDGKIKESLVLHQQILIDCKHTLPWVRKITDTILQVITNESTLTLMAENDAIAEEWNEKFSRVVNNMIDLGVRDLSTIEKAYPTYTPSLIYFYKKKQELEHPNVTGEFEEGLKEPLPRQPSHKSLKEAQNKELLNILLNGDKLRRRSSDESSGRSNSVVEVAPYRLSVDQFGGRLHSDLWIRTDSPTGSMASISPYSPISSVCSPNITINKK